MRVECEHLDLRAIAFSGQCFRWKETGESGFEIPAFDRILHIREVDGCFDLSCDEEEYREIWHSYLDMDTDYKALDVKARAYGDPFLDSALESNPGVRILRQDFWEALISFLISQNNNIPRIKKSIDRLCGGKVHFPRPEEIMEMDLSDMGLGYRDEYLKCAARWYLNGNRDICGNKCAEGNEDINSDKDMAGNREINGSRDIPGSHDTDGNRDICGNKDLDEIKGVGPKVKSCVLLYGMHRMDECPMDTWMKRMVREVYGGKVPEWVSDENAGYYQQLCFMKMREEVGK
ncbi:MAG: hypothetical protein K6E33_06870 [Lachnospiraceae bacterium]|nr:hypothetical protein [Lachnospiraceae bacterium]